MRLGQLARKVSVHTSDIVTFLSSQNSPIEDNSNTRVTDEDVERVFKKFAPHLITNVIEERVEDLAVREIGVAPEKEPIQAAIDPILPIEPKETDTELPDVIKAPKVELKGLTVLGKIELPSPKPKEAPSSEGQESSVSEPTVEKSTALPVEQKARQRRNDNLKGRREERPRKNPVALKREREAREAEEKRKAEALRLKEKKTLYYQNRVKPSVPTKAVRLVDEPLVHADESTLKEPPTTWFGKLLRWFTT